jgi:hypothetical protein
LVEFFLTKCDIFIQGCIPLSGWASHMVDTLSV